MEHPQLFETEYIEKQVTHPHQIMTIADRLHDEGRIDEADMLLDSSANLIELVDKYSQEYPDVLTSQY